MQYRFIELDYDIPIVTEPLSEILPAADCFSATFSSTVEWAVLCKIPSIVFDFYGFDYDMYDDYDGVVLVKEKADLKNVLNKIKCNQAYRQHLSLAHKKKAAELSPFDGKCAKRIIAACCDLD
jgi:hypothetical protein